MHRKFYLGVDGGSTKTEVALLDQEGIFLGSVRGPGTYIHARASKTILDNLKRMIRTVCRRAKVPQKQIAHYGFGLAGVDYPDEFVRQKNSLLRPLGIDQARATVVNDGIIALWGGANSKQALILQVGTGFTAAYRCQYGGETPFDVVNCGVIANVRRDIYVTSARVWDGREKPSILPALLMDYFAETDPFVLVRKLRRNQFPREKVMNVLVVLNEAVAKKDKVALNLVERAAEHYAWDIGTLIRKIGHEKVEIVLGGGVLQNGPPLLLGRIGEKACKQHPKSRVHKAYLPPAVGAAVMAAYYDGNEPVPIYRAARKTCSSTQTQE